MKLIRLTDDHYILDAGPDIDMQRVEEMQRWFADWWSKETTVPTTAIIGGSKVPLEFEDRRTSDLEGRVQRLEEHTHIDKHEPPVGGIEQFQAEDR